MLIKFIGFFSYVFSTKAGMSHLVYVGAQVIKIVIMYLKKHYFKID